MATLQVAPQVPNQNGVLQTHTKAMRRLAITEVVLGSLSVLIGVTSAGVASNYRFAYSHGEGIWCGIFVIIAGAVGIPASGPDSTPALINCHMAFCIIGTCFSVVLFIISLGFSFSIYPAVAALASIQDILSIVSFCILPASAGLCCQSLPGCCTQAHAAQTQVSYVTTSQQPIAVQGAPVSGYVVQGYQAQVPGQVVVTSVPVQQPVATIQPTPGSPVQAGYNYPPPNYGGPPQPNQLGNPPAYK